jgi:hypothetical protein
MFTEEFRKERFWEQLIAYFPFTPIWLFDTILKKIVFCVHS